MKLSEIIKWVGFGAACLVIVIIAVSAIMSVI